MRRISILLSVTFIGLLAVALVTLATPIGRGLIAGFAERAASSNGITVTIETARGWPPFWFGADKVTVADAAGIFVEIEGVEIDVGVFRFLTGRIALDAVTAERVRIARRPELPPSDSSGALVAFLAKHFAIAQLELGEGLAGRRAVLSAEGSVSIGGDGSLDMEVHASRLDGQTGRFDAVLSRAGGDALFSADIGLSEAADGILVGLIGRGSGPAYNLTARAAPEGEAVRGSVTLASDAAAQFSGGFAYSSDGAVKNVEVTARGDLAELTPTNLAGLLSGPIDIVVDANWMTSDDRQLPSFLIRQGRFNTKNVNAAVSGTLSREVADLSFNVDIADPAGAEITVPMLAENSALRSAALRGTVKPSDGVFRLDAVGNIAGLQSGDISVPATGLSLAVEMNSGAAFGISDLPFALRLEADAIRTPSGDLEAAPDAPLLLTADGVIGAETGIARAIADLRVAGGLARFDGTVSADQASGAASASFGEVRALSPLVQRSMSGAVNASANGQFFGAGGTDLKIAATLADFDPGNDTVGRLLRGQTEIAADLARTPQGRLSISSLEIDGNVLKGAGEASIVADNLEASLEGTIADLSVLADNTNGVATFTGKLSGALSRPTVEAALGIADGRLLNHPIRDGVARLMGNPTEDGWTGRAELEGGFAGKPLAGTVDIVATGGGSQFAFPGIDVTIDDNRISGALDRADSGLLSGSLDIAAPNVTTLAALALIEAAGSGRARIAFSPDGGRQSIAVSFAGSDISYSSVTSRAVEGSARIADAFGALRVNADITMSASEIGSARLDEITGRASVEGDSTAFEVRAIGDQIDLAGAGTVAPETGANVVLLNAISGSAFGVPVELQEPVSIRLGAEGGQMQSMRIAVGGGTIAVDGAVSPNLDLTIVADSVPASIANGFANDLGAGGLVTARASATGNPASPMIAWQLDWTGMELTATRKARLPPLTLSANGRATRRDTTIDGTLAGGGLSLSMTGNVPFEGEGLAVAVRASAPLSLLALETTRELRLGGDAQVDVNVSGPVRAPLYSGTVDLDGGTMIDGETGFGMTEATGRIVFDGQRASFERISGRAAQGGEITISGFVDIAGQQMPGEVTVVINDGRYNDGQIVNALFDANLTVRGPLLGGATLTGEVTLGRTEIELPDRLSTGTATIDVTHINTPPDFVPPIVAEPEAAARPSATGNLRLDVALTSTGGIFVRGLGVDSEFDGSLRVTNTIGDPQAVGGFTLRRGRIEVIGRRFELASGTLTFAGDLVPVVDFTATASTTDAVVTVHVTGPADNPTISFTSNPDLPEEEIFSRLLFERSASKLSVLQAAQLVDAAAQFSGVAGGKSIFARIRDAVGVDDLDIRQNAGGGTTVGIGKRINENISLGVEAGTESSDGRVTIDLEVTPNLKARGEAGQSGTGSVGLTYEHEY